MRLVRPQYDECDSAREALSLALDDDLSELEELRLQAHLARCASCRAFGAGLGGFTDALRSAEPQRPACAIVLPRRRRLPIRVIEGAAVAAAIGVLASSALLNGFAPHRFVTSRGQSRPAAALASSGAERVFSHDPQPVSAPAKHLHAV
jgi:predicted anti-sigma-YlaC factor YlaD